MPKRGCYVRCMAQSPDGTALIGLDWGTTSFRAYRLDADGRVLDRISSDVGILAVTDGEFAAALHSQITPWLTGPGTPPILACGMIGSRQGWHEAPYVDLPAGTAELAGSLVSATIQDGLTIHFVPGLSWRDAEGVPDVMRGEETQLIGAMGRDAEPSLFVLPGTHSKWAVAADGRIRWFATFMTGELFAILGQHSILGRLMSGSDHDPSAFRRGLDTAMTARSASAGLLHRLFSARSLPLFGDLPQTGVASYLSGLLIGTEIVEASNSLPDNADIRSVTIVGRSDLASRYATGLAAKGFAVDTADPDASAAGLHRLALTSALLQTEPT